MAESRLTAGLGIVLSAAVLIAWWPTRATQVGEPFRGVTTDGTVQPGVFPIRSTGVSTQR